MERSRARHGTNWLVAAVAVVAAAVVGCKAQPNAAARLSKLESEPREDLELSAGEQAEVVAAMKTVAVGHRAKPGAEPAVQGMRWSDIPGAVATACDQAGVEMVVINQHERAWGHEFELRTADDRPARLEVRATHDERIYTASASIGRFDTTADAERAALLLEELDRAMRRIGNKRRLPE